MVPPPNLKTIMPAIPLLKKPMTTCESQDPGTKTSLEASFVVVND